MRAALRMSLAPRALPEQTVGRRSTPCGCPPQVPNLVLLEGSPAEAPQHTELHGPVLAPRQLRAC